MQVTNNSGVKCVSNKHPYI